MSQPFEPMKPIHTDSPKKPEDVTQHDDRPEETPAGKTKGGPAAREAEKMKENEKKNP